MRVIAGLAKGRNLKSVPGQNTRPILDRVKTAIFNSIQYDLENKNFLDLFAGTGAVGIEALSRGVDKAYFIELNRTAYNIVKENLESTKLINNSEVRHTDAFSYLRNTKKSFDYIYIDPPQFQNLWIETLQFMSERPNLLNKESLIIAKIHPKEYEGFNSNIIKEIRQKRYGNSLVVYFVLC